MNKNRSNSFFLYFMPLLGLFSLGVFIGALFRDAQAEELELFEQIARILGYALVLAISAFVTAAAYRRKKELAPEKPTRNARICAYASVLLLCAHDILLYDACGNVLEGSFTMSAFFALDAALLLIYAAQLVLRRKRPRASALRVLPIVAALLWAVYMFGDMAGYPLSPLTEWDEPLMKLIILCHQLSLLTR